MDIMNELSIVRDLYVSNDFSQALRTLNGIWESIPEPKTEVLNAYMAIEYGVTLALKIGDLEEASKWASYAPSFIEKRHDSAEVEFLVGKVAYERGDMELARQQLSIAYQKSEGRIFEGQHPKYLSIVR